MGAKSKEHGATKGQVALIVGLEQKLHSTTTKCADCAALPCIKSRHICTIDGGITNR